MSETQVKNRARNAEKNMRIIEAQKGEVFVDVIVSGCGKAVFSFLDPAIVIQAGEKAGPLLAYLEYFYQRHINKCEELPEYVIKELLSEEFRLSKEGYIIKIKTENNR